MQNMIGLLFLENICSEPIFAIEKMSGGTVRIETVTVGELDELRVNIYTFGGITNSGKIQTSFSGYREVDKEDNEYKACKELLRK